MDVEPNPNLSSDEDRRPTNQRRGLNRSRAIFIDDETESIETLTPRATTQPQASIEHKSTPRPSLHSQFDKVCTKNAKCDQCEKRNISVIQKCRTCGLTTCKACHDVGRHDNRHILTGLDLDWEPPVRDKRGRTTGTQSFGGATKARRGRPTTRPGANVHRAANRGLVWEPPIERNEMLLASARPSNDITEESSDSRSVSDDLTEDYTTEGLGSHLLSGLGTEDRGQYITPDREASDHIGDTIYVKTPPIVHQNRINPGTSSQQEQGSRDYDQAISTRGRRTALPTARPKQPPSRSSALTRPLRATPGNTQTDRQGIAGILRGASRKPEAGVHKSGTSQHQHVHSASQSGQTNYRSSAGLSLRRIASESLALQSYRGPPQFQSPSSSIPAPMDLDGEPRFQVDTRPHVGREYERPEVIQAIRDLEYARAERAIGDHHGPKESMSQSGSTVASRPERLESIRDLGLPTPSRSAEKQIFRGQAKEIGCSTYFHGNSSREVPRPPNLSAPRYSEAPGAMPPPRPTHQDQRHRESHDEEQPLVSQLKSDWEDNPIIRDERNDNGDLAALDLLQASAILEGMRHGMPPGSLSGWFNKMRTVLRDS